MFLQSLWALKSGMKKKAFSYVLVSHNFFFSFLQRSSSWTCWNININNMNENWIFFHIRLKVHLHNYFPLVGPFGTSNDRLQNWTETWKNPWSLTTAPDMMSKSKIDRIISTHCHCCQSWFWKLEEFFLCEIKNNNSCLILGGGMLL